MHEFRVPCFECPLPEHLPERVDLSWSFVAPCRDAFRSVVGLRSHTRSGSGCMVSCRNDRIPAVAVQHYPTSTHLIPNISLTSHRQHRRDLVPPSSKQQRIRVDCDAFRRGPIRHNKVDLQFSIIADAWISPSTWEHLDTGGIVSFDGKL